MFYLSKIRWYFAIKMTNCVDIILLEFITIITMVTACMQESVKKMIVITISITCMQIEES